MKVTSQTETYEYWHNAMTTSLLWFLIILFFALNGLLVNTDNYTFVQMVYSVSTIVFLLASLFSCLLKKVEAFMVSAFMAAFSLIFRGMPQEKIDPNTGIIMIWFCLGISFIFLWLAFKQYKRSILYKH